MNCAILFDFLWKLSPLSARLGAGTIEERVGDGPCCCSIALNGQKCVDSLIYDASLNGD